MTPEEYETARLHAGLTHRQVAETILDIAERTWHGRIRKARDGGGVIKLSRLERDALYAALTVTSADSPPGPPARLPDRTLEQVAGAVVLLEQGQAEVFRELGELRTLLAQLQAQLAPPRAPSTRTGTGRPEPDAGTGR